jgi:hypothetical protein
MKVEVSRDKLFLSLGVFFLFLILNSQALAQCNKVADPGTGCGGFTGGGAAGGECVSPEYTDSITGTESGGEYNCINSIGANGRYQFMDGTRADLCAKHANLPCVSAAEFAHCPALQDAYFQAFNKDNYEVLKNCGALEKVGQTINGVVVTESGLLAAAHLGGAGGACKWANSNGAYNPNDGATSLTDYAQKHGGVKAFASGSECKSVPPTYPPYEPPTSCSKGPGIAICKLPDGSMGTPLGGGGGGGGSFLGGLIGGLIGGAAGGASGGAAGGASGGAAGGASGGAGNAPPNCSGGGPC